MSNRELIESALKRVNALSGANGKLYHDKTGWFVSWFSIFEANGHRYDESAKSAGELLAYLHGIEDAFLIFKNEQKVVEDV